jgi:hypothetical protein
MPASTAELIALLAAAMFGLLPLITVVAFVFSREFRRDILRWLKATPAPNNAGMPPQQEVEVQVGPIKAAAKGIAVGLTLLFVLSFFGLIYVLNEPKPAFASQELEKMAAETARKAEQEIEAVRQDAANKFKAVRAAAFYTGEHARAPFGRHFGCGTNPAEAAVATCGAGTPISIEAVASHGGNKCGYTYYAVACAPR